MTTYQHWKLTRVSNLNGDLIISYDTLSAPSGVAYTGTAQQERHAMIRLCFGPLSY
jgi:hypothetical protein